MVPYEPRSEREQEYADEQQSMANSCACALGRKPEAAPEDHRVCQGSLSGQHAGSYQQAQQNDAASRYFCLAEQDEQSTRLQEREEGFTHYHGVTNHKRWEESTDQEAEPSAAGVLAREKESI
jgi:hypothetical protein